ncbi:hypothetical protein L1887_35782 [Cichorium endivia]|nr:hypothetical protein L1887_35782 [Cichorium endivia]
MRSNNLQPNSRINNDDPISHGIFFDHPQTIFFLPSFLLSASNFPLCYLIPVHYFPFLDFVSVSHYILCI